MQAGRKGCLQHMEAELGMPRPWNRKRASAKFLPQETFKASAFQNIKTLQAPRCRSEESLVPSTPQIHTWCPNPANICHSFSKEKTVLVPDERQLLSV